MLSLLNGLELSMLGYITLGIIVSSFLGLSGGWLLLWQEQAVKKVTKYLVSFAVGAMLAAVFTDLLPDLIEEAADLRLALLWVLGGILLFYLLEKSLIIYHCHQNEDCEIHGQHTSALIIASDTVHNFIDGMVVASAFLVDIRLGFITTFAVLLHELPQEVGDFAVLLHNGLAKAKIFWYNILSAAFSLVGGYLVYFLHNKVEMLSLVLLAMAIGNFIYIACTDLIPLTHEDKKIKSILIHFVVLLLGLAAIIVAGKVVGH